MMAEIGAAIYTAVTPTEYGSNQLKASGPSHLENPKKFSGEICGDSDNDEL